MKRHGSDVPGHGPSALAAATADSLPAQADALLRARAFAEPLLAGALLDTGENILAHADAVAAILESIGGSQAMQAASYLVYACEHLNKPHEVIAKAFGDSFATWRSRPPSWCACSAWRALPKMLPAAAARPRPWRKPLPRKPRACARCCWRFRATCGW